MGQPWPAPTYGISDDSGRNFSPFKAIQKPSQITDLSRTRNRIIGVSLVATLPPSRIEAYENGFRVPVARRPPLFSAILNPGVILERHASPQACRYGEREHLTHVLFLAEADPVQASLRAEGRLLRRTVRPGEVWIVPRMMPHSSVFDGPHGGVVLSIDGHQFERHTGPLMHGNRIELRPQFGLHDDQLAHLLRGIVAVAEEGPDSDLLVGELLTNAISIRMAKRYAVSKLNVVPRRGGLPAKRLRRVIEYIEGNLNRNISLSALSDTANISLYYFATLFKQSTGLTPHRYVLEQRINKAKQLLRDTRHSILEIALSLGFEHQNNFSRAFRQVTGVTPKEYRLNIR